MVRKKLEESIGENNSQVIKQVNVFCSDMERCFSQEVNKVRSVFEHRIEENHSETSKQLKALSSEIERLKLEMAEKKREMDVVAEKLHLSERYGIAKVRRARSV